MISGGVEKWQASNHASGAAAISAETPAGELWVVRRKMMTGFRAAQLGEREAGDVFSLLQTAKCASIDRVGTLTKEDRGRRTKCRR